MTSKWVERSGSQFGGTEARRWRERSKPGEPGVLECVYLDGGAESVRGFFAEPVGLQEPGAPKEKRSARPAVASHRWTSPVIAAKSAPTRSRRKVTPAITRSPGQTFPLLPRVRVSTDVIHQINELEHDDERGFFVYGRISGNEINCQLPDRSVMRGIRDTLRVDDDVRNAAIDLASARRCNITALVHTHPNGVIGLSDADLDFARAAADLCGHAFAMLIAGPRDISKNRDTWDSNGWVNPKVGCWAAMSGDIDHADVVPAKLIIESDLAAA